MRLKSNKQDMIGWCLIPPAILSREDISDSQKLLMGRILGLLNDEGYCFASNAWLGVQLGLKRIRVSQLLSDLQKKGLLDIRLIRNANHSIIKRKIFPVINQSSSVIENDNTCYKKVKGVLSKSDIPLLSKSEKVVIENREIERESNHQTKKTSDVQEFIKFYFEEYRKKFKTDPPFKGGRDGQTVKTLLKMMTLDILKINISRYLETEDLFFRKNGYDIPRFEKFLDGIKCGAYEAGESCVPASNASQDDVLLDPATGNPLQTARVTSTRKSVQQRFKENSDPDEEVIYDAAGLPVKTLTSSIHRPSARDIVRKEFGSADLLLKGDEVKISPPKKQEKK